MRLPCLCAFALLLTACATPPTAPEDFEVSITGVRLRHMVREDFLRIAEYRTGLEYTGNRVVMRTQPADRNGFYFIVFLDKPVRKIPYGTQVLLDVLTPYDGLPREYVFEFPPDQKDTRELFLGLTGSDWESENDIPIAWKIRLKRKDVVYDTHRSFLWTFD